MKKVLVVDDSVIGREIVARVLGSAYEVLKAGSGEEALRNIAETRPDLVLLDLLMPGMDGFAVLQSLKDAGNTVPVFVLSADIQKSTRNRVVELGAVDLLNKPVDPDSLRLNVSKILETNRGS